MTDSFNLALMHRASLTLAEFPLPQHISNSHHPICYWKESYYLLVSTSGMQSLTENPWEVKGVLQVQPSCCWNTRVEIQRCLLSPFMHPWGLNQQCSLCLPKKKDFSHGQAVLRSYFLLLYESLGIISMWGEVETSHGCPCFLWPWISRIWTLLCCALEPSLECQKATGPSILWAGLFTMWKLLWIF